jgi:hypothetical protein
MKTQLAVGAIVSALGSILAAPVHAERHEPLKMYSWEQARRLASAEQLPIFAHFSASWCKPCEVLKREIYPQPAVAKRLVHFVMTEVETEAESGAALWMSLKEDTLPVLAFFDASGAEYNALRIKGSKTAAELVDLLDAALEHVARQQKVSPAQERAAARGRAVDDRITRTKVRGGQWQTTDTSWLGTAVLAMAGVLLALVTAFIALKARRRRSPR